MSNPGILKGTPVFRGTRLPVQTLFDYLSGGLTLDHFLETFEGVTRERAQAVLSYGWERIAAELAHVSQPHRIRYREQSSNGRDVVNGRNES